MIHESETCMIVYFIFNVTRIQVRHVPQGGPITTNRVDMAFGPTVSLSLWGVHRPSTGAIDMVVGLNAGALAQLRVKPELLPEGYMLPVALRGTIDSPSVDFGGAARRLAALLLRQQYYTASTSDGLEGAGDGVGGDKASTTTAGSAARLGGLLGRAVCAFVTPTKEGIAEIEASMKKDIDSVPKPWHLG